MLSVSCLCATQCQNVKREGNMYFKVIKDGKEGVVNSRNEWVIQPGTHKGELMAHNIVWNKEDGVVTFLKNNTTLTIEGVVNARYSDEKLVVLKEENKKNEQTNLPVASLNKAYKFEVYDQKGNFLFEDKQARWYLSFTNKFAAFAIVKDSSLGYTPAPPVNEKLKWGVIDQKGEIIVSPDFSEIRIFDSGQFAVKNNQGKWSCLDEHGNPTMTLQFDYVSYWDGHFAIVMNGQKWGVVNKDNEYIITPKYALIQKGAGTSILVADEGEFTPGDMQIRDAYRGYWWSLFDVKKKEVNTAKYYWMRYLGQGVYELQITKDSEKILVDKDLEKITTTTFNYVEKFRDKQAVAAQGQKYGVINEKAAWLIPPEYESVESCW